MVLLHCCETTLLIQVHASLCVRHQSKLFFDQIENVVFERLNTNKYGVNLGNYYIYLFFQYIFTFGLYNVLELLVMLQSATKGI